MSNTDDIHVIHPTAADHEFRFEQQAVDWYVLLWSQRQNAFHIERHKHMLDANRRAYAEDRCIDYVPLIIGTHDFCYGMADKLRATLQRRALAEFRTAAVIKTAAAKVPREPNPPNERPFKGILNALDRQATDLEEKARLLFQNRDYSAEFPAADAEMLRAAGEILTGIQGGR